jgi:hypothetical protein
MNTIYIVSGIIIILIIISIIHLFINKDELDRSLDRKYSIYLKTHNGIIKTDPIKGAAELSIIRNKIYNGASGACENLVPSIKKAINKLKEFNQVGKSNPLCSVDLRANIDHQNMLDSITPDPYHWENTYKKTLLEDESELEMDVPINRLKYLIKHMDLTIELLRNNVCGYGELDLEELQNILINLNKQICVSGSMNEPEIVYQAYPYNRYDKVPVVSNLTRVFNSAEPFASSSTTMNRQSLDKTYDYFENKINSKNNNENIGDTRLNNNRSTKTDKNIIRNNSYTNNNINNNIINSLAREIPELDYERTTKQHILQQLNSYNELDARFYDNLSSKNLENTDVTFMSDDRLKPVGDYSEVMEDITIGGRSLEGTTERDINGYKQPGAILSQFKTGDISDMYTVNVGACGGKTVPDSELIKECVGPTMDLLDALNGDPTKMLGCIGDCTDDANYKKWFNNMGSSSAAMYSYGVDYYSPKSIQNF